MRFKKLNKKFQLDIKPLGTQIGGLSISAIGLDSEHIPYLRLEDSAGRIFTPEGVQLKKLAGLCEMVIRGKQWSSTSKATTTSSTSSKTSKPKSRD